MQIYWIFYTGTPGVCVCVCRILATPSKTAAKTTFWDEIQCTMYLGESHCEMKGMFIGK